MAQFNGFTLQVRSPTVLSEATVGNYETQAHNQPINILNLVMGLQEVVVVVTSVNLEKIRKIIERLLVHIYTTTKGCHHQMIERIWAFRSKSIWRPSWIPSSS